jgi:surface polysaccharide O-acyltransferase-like enzyme
MLRQWLGRAVADKRSVMSMSSNRDAVVTTATGAGPAVQDPLLAEPRSFPEAPLIADERPPILDPRRVTLLHVNPTKQHMENLDTLRIVSMLVIILTHITQPYVDHWSEHTPYGGMYNAVFGINVAMRFGVPCFMMISFFIYWHQLYDKGRSWGELLARRFKRLLPAFICWSLFYFALHKVLASRGLNVDKGPLGDRLNWKDLGVWKDILLLGRAHEHLYYLPVVMCSLLLIPLLRVLWTTHARAWTWITATLLLWTFAAYGSSFYPPASRVGHAAERVMVVWRNVLAIPLLVFPLMGMMCAGQRSWREFICKTPAKFWVGMLVVGLAMHVTETLVILNWGTTERAWGQALAGLKVGRFVSAVPIFVLILRHPLMKDPLPRVSHYAFGLHFMHPAIIIALTLIEGPLLGTGAMGLWDSAGGWGVGLVGLLAINYVLTFLITFGLCLLIGRFKRLEFLVV